MNFKFITYTVLFSLLFFSCTKEEIVTEEVYVTEEVIVEVEADVPNQSPQGFGIANIVFDNETLNDISVDFTSGSDFENDVLTYNLYLNDELVFDDFTFDDGQYLTTVDFEYDFSSQIDEDFTFVLEAIDSNGASSNSTVIYNSSYTDVDLGLIDYQTPLELDYSFILNELDNKILYRFELDEFSDVDNFSVFNIETNNYYFTINLLDSNYESVVTPSNYSISGTDILDPGVYYLELSYSSIYAYVNQPLLIDIDETFYIYEDYDFGQISLPFSSSLSFSNQTVYPKLYFTITQTGTYVIETFDADFDTYLYLYTSSGSIIDYNDDGGIGTLSRMTDTLSPGSYYILLEGFGTSTGTGNVQIDITAL